MKVWIAKISILRVCVASFPDSTPQLFIAPCINGAINGAIKSWGVESGNEARFAHVLDCKSGFGYCDTYLL